MQDITAVMLTVICELVFNVIIVKRFYININFKKNKKTFKNKNKMHVII